MDLTGTDLDVAVNALIGSMLQNGYLSELQNAILVSVENQDAARSAQLQQQLTDTINSVFQGGHLEGAVLTQTVTETADLNDLARQYGISVGKAALIQDVTAQDATLTFASLAPLSVNEIALIAESPASGRPVRHPDGHRQRQGLYHGGGGPDGRLHPRRRLRRGRGSSWRSSSTARTG